MSREPSAAEETAGLFQRVIASRSLPYADDPGIAYDVDMALRMSRSFTWTPPTGHGREGLELWQIEWTGSGDTVSDVDRDFFAVVADLAGEATFIHRIVRPDTIDYVLITASLDPPFHLDRVYFELVGPRIAIACASWWRSVESVEQWKRTHPDRR